MSDSASADNSNVHPAALDEPSLLAACDVRRTRASGPGGQHRNKVETGIEITHRPTGLVAVGYERRSQEQNRRVAVRRLRQLLAIEHRNVTSEVVEPSQLWDTRCKAGKIHCSSQHVDFPSMLAEAMNAIYAKSGDVKKAAAALGCSSSQLVRFLGKLPEALQKVNRDREALGLRKLRA